MRLRASGIAAPRRSRGARAAAAAAAGTAPEIGDAVRIGRIERIRRSLSPVPIAVLALALVAAGCPAGDHGDAGRSPVAPDPTFVPFGGDLARRTWDETLHAYLRYVHHREVTSAQIATTDLRQSVLEGDRVRLEADVPFLGCDGLVAEGAGGTHTALWALHRQLLGHIGRCLGDGVDGVDGVPPGAPGEGAGLTAAERARLRAAIDRHDALALAGEAAALGNAVRERGASPELLDALAQVLAYLSSETSAWTTDSRGILAAKAAAHHDLARLLAGEASAVPAAGPGATTDSALARAAVLIALGGLAEAADGPGALPWPPEPQPPEPLVLAAVIRRDPEPLRTLVERSPDSPLAHLALGSVLVSLRHGRDGADELLEALVRNRDLVAAIDGAAGWAPIGLARRIAGVAPLEAARVAGELLLAHHALGPADDERLRAGLSMEGELSAERNPLVGLAAILAATDGAAVDPLHRGSALRTPELRRLAVDLAISGVRTQWAFVQHRLGSPSAALEWLGMVPAPLAAEPGVQALRALTFAALNRTDEARAEAAPLMGGPDRLHLKLELAQTWALQKLFATELEAMWPQLERAFRLEAAGRFRLAHLGANLGHPEAAEGEFRASLGQNPYAVEVWTEFARRTGWSEPIEGGLERLPHSAVLHLAAAERAEKDGRGEEALAHFVRARELYPRLRGAHEGLARLHLGEGRRAEGRAAYEGFLAVAPDGLGAVEIGNRLGWLDLCEGETAAALARFEAGARAGQASAILGLGDTYLALGRTDEARAQYRQAFDRYAGCARCAERLARLLDRTGAPREELDAFLRDVEARVAPGARAGFMQGWDVRRGQPAWFEETPGVTVHRVEPGGQGAALGLRSGDVLLRYGGEPVRGGWHLDCLSAPAGSEVSLDLVRPGNPATSGERLTLKARGGPLGLDTFE